MMRHGACWCLVLREKNIFRFSTMALRKKLSIKLILRLVYVQVRIYNLKLRAYCRYVHIHRQTISPSGTRIVSFLVS